MRGLCTLCQGRFAWLVLLPTLLGLTACSGLKTYPNDLPKNLEVRAKVSSDSIMLKAAASLHIYRVDGPCSVDYLGTLDISDKPLAVGLPVGKPSYLSIEFNTSGVLGGYSTSTNQNTLLTPRSGHRYTIDASYVDSIYSVSLVEKTASGARRELPMQKLTGCQAK